MEFVVKKFALPKMSISLLLAALAAALLIFINEASFQQSTTAVTNMEQAQQTRSAINTLLREVLNAETGQRGYLLTGDESYLIPYSRAIEDIPPSLDILRRLLTAATLMSRVVMCHARWQKWT